MYSQHHSNAHVSAAYIFNGAILMRQLKTLIVNGNRCRHGTTRQILITKRIINLEALQVANGQRGWCVHSSEKGYLWRRKGNTCVYYCESVHLIKLYLTQIIWKKEKVAIAMHCNLKAARRHANIVLAFHYEAPNSRANRLNTSATSFGFIDSDALSKYGDFRDQCIYHYLAIL